MSPDPASVVPSLESLHALGARQQPTYPDRAAHDAAIAKLRTMPPLVVAGECDDLVGAQGRGASEEASCIRGAASRASETSFTDIGSARWLSAKSVIASRAIGMFGDEQVIGPPGPTPRP